VIADVTHFTLTEGGDAWHPWPFRAEVKPSNPELLCMSFIWENHGYSRRAVWTGRAGDGIKVKFHALKLSDGAEWDAVNGFRRPENKRPH
jgi:hypothetical protein